MPLYLVRHGKAGSRHDWKGADSRRPLSKKGRRQADALVSLLADGGATAVYSSPSLRCVQTVQPLADKLGLAVEAKPELGEGTARSEVAAFVGGLLATTAVLCTHGDMMPKILDALAADHGLDLPRDYPYAKAATWEVATNGAGALTARYLPPPK
ncbi:MAG: 8-oxo-(d)GTP phosphatase [Acidimicrobiaceae bacterium]|jgi:phosphohistidine phosphatase SixA